MVLDSFTSYFGIQSYEDLHQKYTQLVQSNRGINLNVLTNTVARGVYGLALPFIFKDSERKAEFLRVLEHSIRQLDSIKPAIKRKIVAEKIAGVFFNTLELFLAVSSKENDKFREFLLEVIEIAPHFTTFVFSKYTEDFIAKMELLEKTVEKAKAHPESFKALDFCSIDYEILTRVSPVLKSKTPLTLEDVKQFISSTHCLSQAKQKTQAFHITDNILPNFFLRFSPLELSKIFNQSGFESSNDDNVSTISDMSDLSQITPDQKNDLNNRIDSSITTLNFIACNLIEQEKSDPKLVLGLVLFSAACTEYGDQIRDLEVFMQDVKIIDVKYDYEQIQKEVMVERNFEQLDIYLTDKSTSAEKVLAFVNSIKKNPKEYDVIFQTDKFGNPFYTLLRHVVFKDQALILSCIKKQMAKHHLKLEDYETIPKFSYFVTSNNIEISEEVREAMRWYFLSNKHALTNLMQINSSMFVLSESYYDLIEDLLDTDDEDFKVKILEQLLKNLLALNLSPETLVSIHKETETKIPKFVAFAKKILTKHYSKTTLSDKITPSLTSSFAKLLEDNQIPSRIGKTFKFTWKVENSKDGDSTNNEKRNFWDKIKLNYVPKIDLIYQNSIIFDFITLLGQDEDLMAVVYSQDEEQKKNWVEDIFSESFASGKDSHRRQRFFQLLSEPLSQFLSSKEREQIIKELHEDFIDLALEFGVKIQIKRTFDTKHMKSVVLEQDFQAFVSKTVFPMDNQELTPEKSPKMTDDSANRLVEYTHLMEQMMSKLSDNKLLMSQLLTNINQIKVLSAKLQSPYFENVSSKKNSPSDGFLLNQFETHKKIKSYQTDTNNYFHALKYAAIQKENEAKKVKNQVGLN